MFGAAAVFSEVDRYPLRHSGETLGDVVFETLGLIITWFLALQEHQKDTGNDHVLTWESSSHQRPEAAL